MKIWRKILKWFFRTLVAVIGLIVLVSIVFRFVTFLRENKTPQQGAPAGGEFVSAGDIKMYVQEKGPQTGQPVVFIHGFGAWSETWRKTLDALAEQGFHVYALDVPPFGFSEKVTTGKFSRQDQAQRIIAVLDSLHLSQVILVGHSVGGRPTVEAALIQPQRIKALVLVDPAMGFGVDGQFEQNHPSFLTKVFFAIKPLRNSALALTVTNPLLTKKLLSTFVADPNVLTPSLLAIYQKPFVVKDSTNRLGDWLKVLSQDQDNSQSANFANFSKLTMPTMLIWGNKDAITPLGQGQKLNQLIPKSSLVVLDGLGHIPQIENPDKFNAALLPFLVKFK